MSERLNPNPERKEIAGGEKAPTRDDEKLKRALGRTAIEGTRKR